MATRWYLKDNKTGEYYYSYKDKWETTKYFSPRNVNSLPTRACLEATIENVGYPTPDGEFEIVKISTNPNGKDPDDVPDGVAEDSLFNPICRGDRLIDSQGFFVEIETIRYHYTIYGKVVMINSRIDAFYTKVIPKAMYDELMINYNEKHK